MYLIPLGLFLKAWTPAASWMSSAATAPDLAALTWSAFFTSLVPVTIGNIIGGGLLVGGGYWLIYLRPSHASGQQIWPGCEWQLHHQASYRPHCYSQLNDYNDHVDYKKVWSHGRAYLDSR